LLFSEDDLSLISFFMLAWDWRCPEMIMVEFRQAKNMAKLRSV